MCVCLCVCVCVCLLDAFMSYIDVTNFTAINN